MDRIKQARERAFKHHQSGFHCAESVLQAILETYGRGQAVTPGLIRAASAFGGGLGRSNLDICGAITGGVLALGSLFGRSEPGQDWHQGARLAAELRKRFVNEFLTTNCGALLATFGPQENMMRCKQLSGEVAGMLAGILEEQTDL